MKGFINPLKENSSRTQSNLFKQAVHTHNMISDLKSSITYQDIDKKLDNF